MFIITQTNRSGHKSIWCTDGEWHGTKFVGFGAKTARSWKTRKGAERYADKRWNHPSNVNRITGVNAHTVQVEAA